MAQEVTYLEIKDIAAKYRSDDPTLDYMLNMMTMYEGVT